MAGRMVHVEIPCDDVTAARAFWGGLFGWEFEAAQGMPGEYHLARIDDASGAAVSDMEDRQGLRTYFDVDDIHASVAKVRELGGTGHDPMAVPTMGWFAICQDAYGNEFGLWQHDPSAA